MICFKIFKRFYGLFPREEIIFEHSNEKTQERFERFSAEAEKNMENCVSYFVGIPPVLENASIDVVPTKTFHCNIIRGAYSSADPKFLCFAASPIMMLH